jgi:hypothetical protein
LVSLWRLLLLETSQAAENFSYSEYTNTFLVWAFHRVLPWRFRYFPKILKRLSSKNLTGCMLRYKGEKDHLNTVAIEAVLSNPSFFQVRILFVPWLIPNWAKAQAWWNVIFVKKGVGLNERLLAHELAHVLQWRSLGVLAFIFHYVRHLILQGYDAHPMEVDATTSLGKLYNGRVAPPLSIIICNY